MWDETRVGDAATPSPGQHALATLLCCEVPLLAMNQARGAAQGTPGSLQAHT
jgi:hypothetical protein